jgi:hypothetical protein
MLVEAIEKLQDERVKGLKYVRNININIKQNIL